MAVQGTWGLGGLKLPDFALTEYLTGGTGGGGLNNPAVYKAAGTTQNQYAQDISQNQQYALSQQGKAVNPYSPYKTSQPQKQTQPPPSNWSSMNPGQKGDYSRGLGFTGPEDYLSSLNQGGGGMDEQALTNQINSSYDPAYANLDSVEAQYRQEYPTSQDFINQSYGEVAPQIENEKNTKLAGIETQRKQGQGEERNQISSARQRYNELKQGLLTRFGGASSTGEAGQELLGRTTSEQMGQTQENFGQLYGDLTKEAANTNDFYTSKITNLEKEKQLKLQQLKNDFDASIRQINTQRAGLDSEKAARRLAALQEYSAQARQMQFDSQKLQQQLEMWRAAKDEALQTAKQYQAKSFSVPGIPGVLGGFSISGGGGSGGQNGTSMEEMQGYIDTNPNLSYSGNIGGVKASYNPKKDDLNDPYGYGT